MYWWRLIKELNRLDYPLPSLLRSSLYHSKTSDQIYRIRPSSRPECAAPIHAIWCGHSSCILSTEICSLGGLTRILEPGHQSFMRNVGDVAAAVVTPIPHDQVILR